jgi:hypothetical protein
MTVLTRIVQASIPGHISAGYRELDELVITIYDGIVGGYIGGTDVV